MNIAPTAKDRFAQNIAGLSSFGRKVIRFGLVVVYLWIGALKFVTYEADSIVPFVANSPFLSFFYSHPTTYKPHMNKEGMLVPENHAWHETNATYTFSTALGMFEVIVGVGVILYRVLPFVSMVASLLIVVMTAGTLSFLITTPETWVPALGDADHGFPYLSGAGRLVIKDLVIMGAAFITAAESASIYLQRKKATK